MKRLLYIHKSIGLFSNGVH